MGGGLAAFGLSGELYREIGGHFDCHVIDSFKRFYASSLSMIGVMVYASVLLFYSMCSATATITTTP